MSVEASGPVTAVPHAATIDRSLISGIAWTGMLRWLGQAVAWVSTLVVARLLTPADYGVYGMASVVLSLLTMLSEFGIGYAVVYLRDLTEHQLAQIQTVSVLFGVAGCLLAAAGAHWVSLFFGNPAVGPVLAVLGTTLVISSFRSVPMALLQRDLRFKRLAVFESGQVIAVACLNVTLAWLGFGYWTLAGGTLLASALSTAVALRYHPCPFAIPRAETVRQVLPHLRDLVLQRVAWWANSSSDMIVAGKTLGSYLAGAYSLAWTLADTPVQKINEVVLRVVPGVFSAAQNDDAAIRRYMLHLTHALSLMLFPATVGLALVASDFVLAVLGAKWVSITLPLRILALYAAVRCLSPILAHVLNIKQQSHFVARINVIGMFGMPAAFYFGGHFGIVGIAMGWVLVHPLFTIPLYWKTFQIIGMRTTDYLHAIAPAAMSSATMAAALLVANAAGVFPDIPAFALAAKAAMGAVVYVGTLWVFHRETVDRLRRAVSSFR